VRTHAWAAGLLAAAFVLLVAGGQAAADIIDPGLDRLKTQPGSEWHLEFAEEGGFAPGSDPFDGQVAIVCPTGVERLGGSNFDDNPDVIPTEIVALNLHSVAPVPITFGGIAVLYDVEVTLDPSGPNAGHFIVSLDPTAPTEGGTIDGDDDPPDVPAVPPDSFFDVSFRFTFIPQDGSAVVQHMLSDRVVLAGDVPWSSTAPPAYAHAGSGGFYPGIDPFAGIPIDPHMPQTLVFQGQAFTWRLRLEPVVPEPGTLGLLALGGLGLLRRRRCVTRDA
jgi:hypothetical protein